MRIHILALNGVFDTGLAAVLDAFSTANALAKMSGTSSLPFQTKVVGLRNAVTTAQGLSVPVTSATRAQTPDAVVMPAINRIVPELLVHALASGEVREAGAVLRKWSGRGALTAAACVGTFVLAEAALLDGEEATTTWWLAPLFRQRYPRVRLDESQLIVQSNAVVTAGAALSHLDLALTLIGRASPELASLTAKYLVADARASQAAYTIPGHLVHIDPLVHKFELWARQRLAEGFSLDQAAAALATSKRTLDGERARQIAARIPPGSADRARRAPARDQPSQRRSDRRRGRLRRRCDAACAAAPEARPRRARNPPRHLKRARGSSLLMLLTSARTRPSSSPFAFRTWRRVILGRRQS
jgi:transcriptional regulator GlxA family with amidase domain